MNQIKSIKQVVQLIQLYSWHRLNCSRLIALLIITEIKTAELISL